MTILTGQGAGIIVALRSARIVIGRGENADLRVFGDTISRNHAQLTRDREGFVKLVDIDSRNGSFVNGLMVRSEILRDGDRVLLGGDIVMDVRYGLADVAPAANDGRAWRQPERNEMHAVGLPEEGGFDHRHESYQRLLEVRRRQGMSGSSLAVAFDGAGSLRRQAGDYHHAQEGHRAALRVLEDSSDASPLERAHTTVRLARALLGGGDMQAAADALDAAESLFASTPAQPGEQMQLHIARAQLHAVSAPDRLPAHEAQARSELKRMDPRSSFFAMKRTVLEYELSGLKKPRRAMR